MDKGSAPVPWQPVCHGLVEEDPNCSHWHPARYLHDKQKKRKYISKPTQPQVYIALSITLIVVVAGAAVRRERQNVGANDALYLAQVIGWWLELCVGSDCSSGLRLAQEVTDAQTCSHTQRYGTWLVHCE